MRRYLAELHKKPDHHKKRFAFLVSGGVTLSIFTIWTVVNFGTNGKLVRNESVELRRSTQEIGPMESLRLGLSSGLEGVAGAFGGMKSAFKGSMELESGYEGMRDNVLNNYGN